MKPVTLFIHVLAILPLCLAESDMTGRVRRGRFGTFVGGNIDRPIANQNFWDIPKKLSRLDGRKLAELADAELTVANVSVMDSDLKTSTVEKKWKGFRKQVQHTLESDLCAMGYSRYRDEWYTCCLFEDGETNDLVGFCGSNPAFELPEPCRDPEEGFDYAKLSRSKVSSFRRSRPRRYNTGSWRCLESDAEQQRSGSIADPEDGDDSLSRVLKFRTSMEARKIERTFRDPTRQDAKHEKSHLEQHMRLSDSGVPVFKVDLSDDKKSASECKEENLRYLCYAFCCDSQYIDSEFCLRQGMTCY